MKLKFYSRLEFTSEALGPTQPYIQWGGVVKRSGHQADHKHPSCVQYCAVGLNRQCNPTATVCTSWHRTGVPRDGKGERTEKITCLSN